MRCVSFYDRLLGPTGSGKSSVRYVPFTSGLQTSLDILTKFIEKATGIKGIVGDGLESSTQELSVFKFTLPEDDNSSTVFLVDTPGFDDTNRTDHDVFETISKWLIKTYVHTVSFPGVLFNTQMLLFN